MLKFFRINDPYRLGAAFLLLIIFRLPFWIEGSGLLVPELRWMIVGERMSEGFVMYYEIWDATSPFSALVYWFIDALFGRSQFVYHLLSLVVAFLQVFLFNYMAYQNKFFPVNSYVPALVYTVLISFSVDFFTLSPMLMGTTFVLLAIKNVISQIEFRAKRDEKLLNIGIYLGIAALFHFPLILLGPIMVVVLLVFSSTVPRRFLMILYGWTVPLTFAFLFYYFQGNLYFFWLNQVVVWFRLPHVNVLPISEVLVVTSPLMLFSFFALLRIFKRARLSNYQSRLIQVMFSSLVLAATILLLEIDRYLFTFIVFIPWIAYFISFYFILSRRSILAELTFFVFLIAVIGNNWYTQMNHRSDWLNMEGYYIEEDRDEEKGSTVAVLADDLGEYMVRKTGTPYINWRLSQVAWDQMNRYNFLALSIESILKERPERIIDPNDYFKKLLQRAPLLKGMYRLEGNQEYVINN